MEIKAIEEISKEAKDLIVNLIVNSYEAQYLGIEGDDYFIENVTQGITLSSDIARDNIFMHAGYDVLYIEECENSMMVKDGLNDEEMKMASEQLDAYLRELSFVSMVNFKIKEVHRLILEGALS